MSQLEENPRFQQLWEASSASTETIPTVRLVDIYPDIRKRLDSLHIHGDATQELLPPQAFGERGLGSVQVGGDKRSN